MTSAESQQPAPKRGFLASLQSAITRDSEVVRNVIIFGETGAGKSSIVNMLAAKELRTTPGGGGSYSVTISGSSFNIVDTIGLNEGANGTIDRIQALKSLKDVTANLDGIHLLVFVVKGDIKHSISDFYHLYYKGLCDSNVPIVLVVTGMENKEDSGRWQRSNENLCNNSGVNFAAQVFGTAVKGNRRFEDTRKKLKKSILEHASRNPWTPPTWGQLTKTLASLFPATFPLVTKNVIIFGETGVGKSSIVNMLAGKPVAQVSNDAVGVTRRGARHPIKIDGLSFNIVDTVGLNEGTEGTIDGKQALASLKDVAARLEGGVHLLVFVMRGRIREAIRDNYRLYYEGFCEQKVPVILVMTGMEDADNLDTWWEANGPRFDSYGLRFEAHVFGTGVRGKNNRYGVEFDATKAKLQSAIVRHASDEPWKPPTWNRLMAILAKLFPALFGGLAWEWEALQDTLDDVGQGGGQ